MRLHWWLVLGVLVGCDDSGGAADQGLTIDVAISSDGSALDAAASDGSVSDARLPDAVVGDARLADAVVADARLADAQLPDMGMADPVEDRLRAHVELLAGEIGARGLRFPDALQRTIGYLTGELESMGYTVNREAYPVGRDEAVNLWVEVPGTDRPDEVMVVGAHYDCVPSTPGADDNASGVAGTLELARVFAQRPQAQTLRFVFFANEEPPYFQTATMGSLVHARALSMAGVNVTSMVTLEMIGFYTDAPDSQDVPLGLAGLFPSMGNFLAFISDVPSSSLLDEAHAAFLGASGFPAEKLAAPGNLPEAGFSDHWSFWQVGYRALMLTDTAFFRNANYHESTDTFDTLDYVRMGALFPGLVGVVEALAD